MDMSQTLEGKAGAVAEKVVARCFQEHPELDLRYGPIGREKCLQDTRFHLQYLIQAVGASSKPLFLDYVHWAKIMLAGVRVPEKDLIYNLELLDRAIAEEVPGDPKTSTAREYIQAAIEAVPAMSLQTSSYVDATKPLGMMAVAYMNLLLAGQRREASDMILRAVESGTPTRDIYLRVFQPTQHELGRLWQTNKITVAQEHYCSAVTQMIMSMLYSRMFNAKKNGFRLLATCVGSELHEIGVRMVADFLELEGWDTFYLGANTPLHSILKAVKERKAHVVALSATMTFHIDFVRKIIETLRTDPETQAVKILVGGYPFNIDPDLWKRIGADGYAANAEQTAVVAAQLVGL